MSSGPSDINSKLVMVPVGLEADHNIQHNSFCTIYAWGMQEVNWFSNTSFKVVNNPLPNFCMASSASVHALHWFCGVLENVISCSLLPRYKSRKSYHQEQSCRTAPKMDKLHNSNNDNMQGKLHCIVVVKHDLLTINAYKLALTLLQKIKCTISHMCCTSWIKCTATTLLHLPDDEDFIARFVPNEAISSLTDTFYMESEPWPQQNVKALTPLLSTYLKKHLSRARDLCVAIWAYSQLC